MILIITETTDISTFKVCEWLLYMQKPFEIINEESHVIVENIQINAQEIEFHITIDNKKYHIDDIKSVWFRRGGIRLLFNKIDDALDKEFKNGLTNSDSIISDFLDDLLIESFDSSFKRTIIDGFENIYKSNNNISLLKYIIIVHRSIK